MPQKALHWVLRIIALISLVSLVFILIKIPPYQNQNPEAKIPVNIVYFFVVFFVFCFSIFSLFFFWIKSKAMQRGERKVRSRTMRQVLGISTRQGFLLALGTIILLLLQVFHVLTWWDGLLAMGAVFMVELYFLSR